MTTTPHGPPPPGPTVGRMLLDRASTQPGDDGLIFPDRRLTFGELAQESSRVARGLVGMGVRPGDRIAILMPNCPEYVTGVFGIALAGAVCVPLNVRYRRRELRHVLADCDARIVLTNDLLVDHIDLIQLVRDATSDLTENPLIVAYGRTAGPNVLPGEDLLRAGDAVDLASLPTDEAEDSRRAVMVMYTSGTTSTPKGCEIRHAGFTSHWARIGERLDLRGGDRHWIPCPFFHMAGIGPVMASVAAGAASISLPRLDPDAVWSQIRSERVTHLHSAFPHITQTVLDHPDYLLTDLSDLRVVLTVGPTAVQRQTQGRLPSTAALVSGYGMTEGTGLVTAGHRSDPSGSRLETVGRPIDGAEIRIVEDGTGRVLDPGSAGRGEIQFRGPSVMAGYYRDPENTARTVLPGGWVRTGDLGKLRENGDLEYHGRVKDMLKVGGENVAASEIEAHLSSHSAVKVAQVVGMPDRRHGEVPVAFVELHAGTTATAEELIRWCQGEIASFKVPRSVRFVTAWPMSATKIQKTELRRLLADDPRASSPSAPTHRSG